MDGKKTDKWSSPLVEGLIRVAAKKRGWASHSWNLRDRKSEFIIYMFYPGTEDSIHKNIRVCYRIDCDKLDDKEYLRKTLITHHDSQEVKDYFGPAEKKNV